MINKCLKSEVKNHVVIVVLLSWHLLLEKTCFHEKMRLEVLTV